MTIDSQITLEKLQTSLDRFWKVSGEKILMIEKNFDPKRGAPVFTVNGQYTTRGWTEWTQGFQFGSALLQFDATGEEKFWRSAEKTQWRKWLRTLPTMACTIMDLTT
jgi:hypothetical protein